MAAVVVVLLFLLWGGRQIAPRLLPLVQSVHQLGPVGPLLFILIYIVAVVALIPGAWLTIAGGAVFGILPTTVYSFIGATIGSTAAFLLGRHAARRFVADHFASMPRFSAIERAVSAEGRRIIVLLRLCPVAPFNVLNYALGLSTISVRDFVLASAGMLPTTIVYAYTGKVAGEALALAGQAAIPRTTSYYAFLAFGLVAAIGATALAARAAGRALRDV